MPSYINVLADSTDPNELYCNTLEQANRGRSI